MEPFLRDPFRSGRPPREVRRDLWFELSPLRLFSGFGRHLSAFSNLLRGFRPRGLRRVAVELVSEGLTLSLCGLTLMLALALPSFEATRTDWRTQLDYSVTFLDRYGNEIGKRGIRHNDAVPLDELPDHLIKAVLATEDRRFFEHFGIDVFGTARAMAANLEADSVVQGGSSITQQLAKNLFLSNERTLERKIKEAFLAIWLESHFSKQDILKLYLDRAYMGAGNFGVAAAAEFYFGKPVTDLDLAESAMLAGLFKAPTRYSPTVDLPAARARANEVLTNLVQAGMMTEGQVIGARRHPADIIVRSAEAAAPEYFLDWAFEQLKDSVRGGDRVLVVRSTIDMDLQRAAEESIEAALRESGEQFNVRQGALVALDPDGAVRAMVGGRDYGESQFNRAADALRQPGSSFKPYVYAAAMENGYTPQSVVPDAPISIGDWSPQNYGRSFSGPVTLTTALVKSINTVPVRLAQAIGRDKIVEIAHRMGITSELLITRSLPLGTTEVSVIDQAAAYATFANGGYRAAPYGFTQIANGQGEIAFDRRRDAPDVAEVLSPEVVAAMNGMLYQVPVWGTGTRARLDGVPTAGKTGTTNAYRDAWFVGYTGNYVAAVWFGNDDFSPSKRLTGGLLPAQAWKRFMEYAHQGIELRPIPFVDDPELPLGGPAVASASPEGDGAAGERPLSLSARATEQLMAIERRLAAAVGEPPLAAETAAVFVAGDAVPADPLPGLR